MTHSLKLNLRMRLKLLILLTLLPAGFLLYYTAEDQRHTDLERFFHHALLQARAAAAEETRQISAGRDLLLTISDFLRIMQPAPDQTRRLLIRLSKRFDGYKDFGVIAPDGTLVINFRSDLRNGNYRDHHWFRKAVSEKQFAMGKYKVHQIDGKPVIYFGLPVTGTGNQIQAVVYAAMCLNHMNRSIFQLIDDLPSGVRLTQIDASGEMLGYNPATKTWSGNVPISASALQIILKQQTGTLKADDDNGIQRIYAFAPLKSTILNRQVYIALDLPKSRALAASTYILRRNLALFFLVMLVAFVIIRRGSDVLIIRRITAIVDTSRRLAEGNLKARVQDAGGEDELSRLAARFNDMAVSLEMRQQQEEAAKEALKESRERLRNLADYLQNVREKERARIAREIHDDFGQALTILKMDLSWFRKQLASDQTEALSKIEAMSQTIDGALQTLHSVSAELRPVILDDFGLSAAVEWQAEEFQHRTGIECRAEVTEPESETEKKLATALFRIFQEILTNIIRHAQATQVEVSLKPDGSGWMLDVADNGRGITEEEIRHPRSFGLIGMRERLYPWNGTVAFTKRRSGGTRVSVRVPDASKRDMI